MEYQFGKEPVWERRFLQEEIDIQRKKANIEQSLRTFEDNIMKYTRSLDNNLKLAIAYIKANKIIESKKFIDEAINNLITIQNIFADMMKIEDVLLSLTTKELKDFEAGMRAA